MNKKFEYVDDNPGAYFGMLVESVEDKKNLRNWIEKRVGKQMSSMKPTKIGYKHGRPYYSVDFVDGTSDDYFIDFDKKEIEKCESLKEDKFIPQDKMSKKAQKELNDKKRGTWGSTNPVTKVQPNKKAYDRKRDKKANLDESKKLNEITAKDVEYYIKYGGFNGPKRGHADETKAEEVLEKINNELKRIKDAIDWYFTEKGNKVGHDTVIAFLETELKKLQKMTNEYDTFLGV